MSTEQKAKWCVVIATQGNGISAILSEHDKQEEALDALQSINEDDVYYREGDETYKVTLLTPPERSRLLVDHGLADELPAGRRKT